LSLTIISGRPRSSARRSSSRPTRDAGERGVDDERQALAGEVIDYGEDTEAAAVDEHPLAAATAPHRQPLLPVDAKELLLVQFDALAPQQDVQASVGEASTLIGQLAQPSADRDIIRRIMADTMLDINRD